MSWDLIRVSPAAYRGSYFRAHHNGFFCGRGRCPKFVRSTGDRCDGEGSTAACNKAFPFAHAQNAFSGLAAVFGALSLARVFTKAELWNPPSPWACAASHPPSLHIGLLGTTAAADRFRLLGYPASPRAERLAPMPSDSDSAKANLSGNARTLALSPERIPIPFSKLP